METFCWRLCRTLSSDFPLGLDFDLINFYSVYKFLSWFVMIVLCCVVLYDFVHCLLLRRNNKYISFAYGGVPNFNVGATILPPTPSTLKLLCVLHVARSNSLPNFSIAALSVMQLCEYICHRLSIIYVPPKWGFSGWRCENIVFYP